MQPLSSGSSSNAERARIEALRGASQAGEPSEGGGFADLLRGAQDRVAPEPPSLPPRATPEPLPPVAKASPPGPERVAQPARPVQGTRPPEPPASQAADADKARAKPDAKADAKTHQSGAKADRKTEAESGPASAASDEADGETGAAREGGGATLAHWLLHGAPATPVPGPGAGADGQAAASAQRATEQPDAATLTRDLLQSLRGRTSAAGAGEAGGRGQAVSGVAAGAARAGAAAAADGAAALPPAQADATGSPEASFAATLAKATGATQTAALQGDATALVAAGAASPGAEPAAQPPAPVVERTLTTPLDAPAFDTAAAVSITRLVREGVHEARLQLNPAEMGPVTVRIEMQGAAAQIEIGAAHAATRQAFEHTLPALAAALQADGLSLAQARVADLPPVEAAGWAAGAGLGSGGGDPTGHNSGQGSPGQPGQSGERGAPGSLAGTYAAGGLRAGQASQEGDAGLRADLAAWRRGTDGLDLYA